MPRFFKRRTSINRRTRRRRGRSRRGGEGERYAITDYDSARNDAALALRLSQSGQMNNPENVPSSVWDKFPNNPFKSDTGHIMESYQHLRPVKGGKTKRKMRKHRK